MKKLWIDIETRSREDLKTSNVYRYSRCPDFRILMASWTDDPERPVETALSYDEIEDIPGLWDPKVLKVAHNAPFERICFSEFLSRTTGKDLTYLPPEHWRDTMAVAAELGYPKSLSKLAFSLGAEPKDEAGTRLINLFCKPNRNGGWNGPDTHPMEWLEFVAYCDQDVSTLVDVDLRLIEQGDWPTDHELEVYLADQRINDRGFAIDLDLARNAIEAGSRSTSAQKQQVRDITEESGMPVENPGSIRQMKAWLDYMGHPLPNLRAETVEKALKEDLPDQVREVLEIRQDLALAAPAKFSAAMSAHVDGRLHGTLAFFGAHTGRWAGRGTQVHNLPRDSFKPEGRDLQRLEALKDLGVPKHEVEAAEAAIVDRMVDAAIVDLELGLGASASTLKKCVRPLFIPDGVVVDYSAIEAVVIAWLAGEEWALQAFREHRDIYVETANRMGGLTRPQGKIAVLALGYNGGPGSLKAMATDKDVIEVNGEKIPLARVPDDVLYDMFVYPWRDANSRIVRLWAFLDRRFRTGGRAGDHLEFEKANGVRDRLLRLPSGRFIGYRKCGVTKYKDDKGKERERLTFWSPQGFRTDTYGGRLAENATQAVARDLLAAALVRLEKAGLEVVAHVHDEIIVQGTKDVDLVKEIMCELPDWAEGLPVSGEGFATYRYRKG